MDLENAEIVRLVRKASVEPGELAGFLDSIKPVTHHADTAKLPVMHERPEGPTASADRLDINMEESVAPGANTTES